MLISVQYGQNPIEFELQWRDRKTLEIAVEPDCRVTVSAPNGVTLAQVKAKVLKRASWIRRQQRFFSEFIPRTPERRFVPGETHLYLGRRYRLRIVPADEPRVTATRGFLTVCSPQPKCSDTTAKILNGWLKARAVTKFSERLEICLRRFSHYKNVRPQKLSIRTMKARWGSLTRSRNMTLNLRLLGASVQCIDYVIIHELCHAIVPNHGKDFYRLLNRKFPNWKTAKIKLEKKLS